MLGQDDCGARGLVVGRDQPLIGVLVVEDDHEITRYFADEADAEAALPSSVQAALATAGAWSDLDWDEMEAALDRIRHESKPTPPFEP